MCARVCIYIYYDMLCVCVSVCMTCFVCARVCIYIHAYDILYVSARIYIHTLLTYINDLTKIIYLII